MKKEIGAVQSWAQELSNPLSIRALLKNGQKKGQMEYTNPRIYDGKGNPDVEWYVEYSFLNPHTGKFKRFKIREGINKTIPSSVKNRYQYKWSRADELRLAVVGLLESGFNPFQEYSGSIVQASRPVVDVFRDLLILKPGLEKRTYEAYTYCITLVERFLKSSHKDGLPVKLFTKVEAMQFHDYLISQRLKNRTINNYISFIKVFFNMMVDKEYIEASPFRKIQKLKVERGVKNIPMTLDEMKIVFPHLRNNHHRLYLLCLFIYYSFFREKELTLLKFEHIDLLNQRIIIPSSSAKNDATATQPIPDAFAYEIKQLISADVPRDWYVFSKHLLPSDKPIHRNRYSDAWKIAVKDGLNIKKDMYAIRHRSAIDYITKGGNIRELQLLLRHHSLEMTEKYISSMVPDLNTGSFTRNIKLDY